MPDSKPQFQHYISQFLLKHFRDPAYASHHKIWRYNLKTNECALEATRDLAGISNVWDREFEEEFSALESKASKLIKKIIKFKRGRKSQKSISLNINEEENYILLNYIIWLTTLQPKRAEFILNHPRNQKDCERLFYTQSDDLSEEQEKLRLSYRKQYERTGKAPSMLILLQQHILRFEEICRNFGKFYFLCTSMEYPFILSDHYITPLVKSNYEKGENPWKAAAQLFFPIASDICLIWNNKNLTDTEIKQPPEIEDINLTAVAYAKESGNKCIYGTTHAVLEEAVKDFNQRGYLGWKAA